MAADLFGPAAPVRNAEVADFAAHNHSLSSGFARDASRDIDLAGNDLSPGGTGVCLEEVGSCGTLKVQFRGADEPRQVSIVGGASAITSAGGIARLDVPGGTTAFDLAVTNDEGESVPFLRVTLDAQGRFAKYEEISKSAPQVTKAAVAPSRTTNDGPAQSVTPYTSAPTDSDGGHHGVSTRVDTGMTQPSAKSDADHATATHAVTNSAPSHNMAMNGSASMRFDRAMTESFESEAPDARSMGEAMNTSQSAIGMVPMLAESTTEVGDGHAIDQILAEWAGGSLVEAAPADRSLSEVVTVKFVALPAQASFDDIVDLPMDFSAEGAGETDGDEASSSWMIAGASALAATALGAAYSIERRVSKGRVAVDASKRLTKNRRRSQPGK